MPGPLDFTIEQLVAKATEQVAESDAARARLREEWEAADRTLREEARTAKRILAAYNPPGPKPGKKGKGKGASGNGRLAPENLDAIRNWLTKNMKGEEFSNLDLRELSIAEETQLSDTTVGKALSQLHDDGALRFVRFGGEGRHNKEKVYQLSKVTTK